MSESTKQVITNEQMIAGRYERRFRTRNLYRTISAWLAKDGRAMHSTYTRSTIYSKKHAGMIRMSTDERCILVQSGKKWLATLDGWSLVADNGARKDVR